MSRRRCIVYIDGFNLYDGAVKGTPHKWLDIQTLFDRIRVDDDVIAVKYFTALVRGYKQARQKVCLDALATLDRVEIILGRFKRKVARCYVDGCAHDGVREFTVSEEKRTDVNIAVAILDDAYQNLADVFVVVSGDADLAPAVRRVRQRFPDKTLVVYVPANNEERGAATELRSAAHKNRTLPMELIQRCQLPNPVRVMDGSGTFITKPTGW